MRSNGNIGNNKVTNNNKNNSHHNINGFLPNSLKFISSCLKTASSGIRSASASVAASISGDGHEHQKDQVLWASFDRLELGSLSFKHALLLGYSNGFQVLDVEDASNVSELVSRRDDPVTFLQMQPLPEKSEGHEGFRASHPLLLVVACDESKGSGLMFTGGDGIARDGLNEPQNGNFVLSPTAVRFYSLRSHNYVHVLRFRSTVYMVRCSPRIVAVGLATQIYCFDSLTFENKFSVLTYPAPQAGGQGMVGVNIGYGPMAVGTRWLAYASNNPLQSNTGRLSPQNLTPSPGVSPSTSPSSGSLVARYAMESSKQLATGLINLGDMGYKTLSKYYQDFVPDGSGSPVSTNTGWKGGRGASHSAETEIAGTVVIKDFVSRAVVSQFRAHTSPISALCFDPSGTLLVTASIHGNNINIFRIMPSSTKNASGTQNYDWSSSHVHLYKLHRGMTSAVIQDICFSTYSQWIAIVSSRGTCHIFVLSPFGGENVLQIQNSHVDGPVLSPVTSLPWWSTPSFMVNHQTFSLPAPATVTLSVVSRIKNGNWLNTVANAASSAAGKASFPSGAFSAVFHNSLPIDLQRAQVKANVLGHLLVYTPSGHVVHHKLLPSYGGEAGESASRFGPSAARQVQEGELHVKVEAMQAWDVCRRTDWPEREECLSGITHGRNEALEMIMDISDSEDNDAGFGDLSKLQDRSHLYLANAEVQISSGRIPIWQNSKVSFFTMSPVGFNEHKFTEDQYGGEIEIEKMSAHEVDIRHRDLLPVFEHFHRLQPELHDRGFNGEMYPMSSSHDAKAKFSEVTVISHTKLMSPSSFENSDSGSPRNSYPPSIQSGKDCGGVKGQSSVLPTPALNQNTLNKNYSSFSFSQSKMGGCHIEDSNSTNGLPSLTNDSLFVGTIVAKEVQFPNIGGTSDVSKTSSDRSDSSMNMLDEGQVNESPDFEQFFQEEYCKALPSSACCEPTEVITDVDSNSSPCDRAKSEEEGDNDDMLGGVFAFSEEG